MRTAEVTEKLAKEKEKLADLEKHGTEEKEHVAKILDIRAKLRARRIRRAVAAKTGAAASGNVHSRAPRPDRTCTAVRTAPAAADSTARPRFARGARNSSPNCELRTTETSRASRR